MKKIDSSIIKKNIHFLLAVAGCILITIGVIFNPEFVDEYIMKKGFLGQRFILKNLLYQLIILTIGFSIVIFSIYHFMKKHTKLIIGLVACIYLLTVYNVFISKMYPNNILMKPSEIAKLKDVLLGKEILLSNFEPTSNLVVKNRRVMKAKYAAIDFHFHFNSMEHMSAEDLVSAMDKLGIQKIVNLDGWPEVFEKYLIDFKNKYPTRFILFTKPNFAEVNKPTFVKDQLDALQKSVAKGAQGIKVWKDLGITIRDNSGKLVAIDDERFDPIWEKAGELGIPVLMHSADPSAFFTETNRFNERFEELSMFPGWSAYGPGFPKKEVLLVQRENMIKKHPNTIFVLAHVGCTPENLDYAGSLLDKYPNIYYDFGAMLSDLGRQPFTARRFFIKYQDRILFGTDGGYALGTKEWPAEKFYSTYFEFLETNNEYFGYPLWDIQGRWKIYGIGLPDEVLEKIYCKNAQKILAAIKNQLF